jgi:energy-coupling factor transporter ATP-binding protein EcfA2
MSWQVLIAHAPGEEHWAETLAHPIREAGYKVSHLGTVLAGESVVEEASQALGSGGPVLLCGTVRAVGTHWARRLVNAARSYPDVQVIVVQVEREADVESLAFGERIVRYWQDPARAMGELLEALHSRYPVERVSPRARGYEAEVRYIELALRTFDAVDLVGLPADRGPVSQAPPLHRLYVPLKVGGLDPQSSVGEAIAATRRLVVLGDPGSGKTTLVRWLATAYLRKEVSLIEWVSLPDVNELPHESLLPVVVSCRDLDPASTAGSLEDILRYILRKAEMSESDTADLVFRLRERLREGRVLLLVDGLDAIPDLRARAGFCRQIEQIAIAYPHTPLVVTSRPAAYRELGDPLSRSFRAVTLADWSREDKDRFVKRWFLWSEPQLDQREQKTDELIRTIHSTQRIERLAGNPLLLTVMALVRPRIGSLPQRRAELYWEAIQVLLGRPPGSGAPLSAREVLPQLEHLAYVMCERTVQQLAQDEVLEVLTDFRSGLSDSHPVQARSPEELLFLVERSTGILRRAGERRHLGMNVPVFELCHPMFQEYLAARAIVDGFDSDRPGSLSPELPLAQRIPLLAGRTMALPNGEIAVRDPWQEVLRLAVACSGGEVDDVLRALLRPLPEEDAAAAARSRSVLAALCLADEPEVGEGTAWEVLSSLARHVRRTEGGPQVRTSLDQAAQELLSSRWAGLFRLALVREFQARGEADRWSIGFYFGKLGALSELRREPLPEAGSGHPATADDLDIAAALEVIGSPASLGAAAGDLASRFLAMLGGGPAGDHAAAWALYSLHGSREGTWRPSAPELERIVDLLGDPGLDAAAAWCFIKILGTVRFVPAAEVLRARLEDPDPALSRAAEQALRRMPKR